MFYLDKNKNLPLYRQLGDGIALKIISGEILADTKLPAIRALAEALEVNNTTIIAAYKYLEQQRLVYSVRGSGTYAAKTAASVFDKAEPEMPVTFNFGDMTPDPAYFPTKAMRHAFDAVLERDGARAFDYPGWRGYEPLREVLNEFLTKTGVTSHTQDIQIIPNINQGLEIVAEGLLKPGDTVLMERPSTQDAAAIFASCGARIVEIPIEHGEPDLDKLKTLTKKHRAKLFFLMPTYQIPTGICYTDKAKAEILRTAYASGAYIIEADSYGDLYYTAKPLPIKAIDDLGHVIYIKSFDRVLAPGLLNFMCHSKEVTSRFQNRSQTSGYIQRSLDHYLREGGFSEHLVYLRGRYARRYRKMLAVLEAYLSPFASYIIPDGGLSFWITPHRPFDYAEEFFARKVLVAPGKLFMGGDAPHFRVSFAYMPEERILEGMGIIASVLANRS